MLNFLINDFSYQRENKVFIQEASMLDLSARYWNSGVTEPIETEITLYNPDTKTDKVFHFDTLDWMDSNHEEVGGWQYKSNDGLILIIIND